MKGKTFINTVSNSEIDIIELILDILADTNSSYCVIGGFAVNAYAEPVISLDLDLVVSAKGLDQICAEAKIRGLKVQKFEHSAYLKSPKSDLRIQLQTDPRYQEFIPRSVETEVLGYKMRVVELKDIMQGKIWAYLDKTRRRSKRQKDLADIMRLVETHPALIEQLPIIIRKELED